MSKRTLKHDLLQKLQISKGEIATYLAMRKAKGYMSVSESEQLRANLLALCHRCHDAAFMLQASLMEDEKDNFRHAVEACSSVAVCLMSGRKDCPQYISVDAVKLEAGLKQLTQGLNALAARGQALEA
ncbi:biofilm formation regulatory protein BssR [Cedecea lapagei]|uniref:Biofilm formation regulatory protein BssR n=1 Tax=Cedecea lapagei TaxID=158823 RepID=A0A3S4KSZ9_9ENTR|nr:biofilm formation regulator BssR [Cedecea lapagei]VEB96282.1 biofilm formation regulatory protein BssR [Cedecea lapagei]